MLYSFSSAGSLWKHSQPRILIHNLLLCKENKWSCFPHNDTVKLWLHGERNEREHSGALHGPTTWDFPFSGNDYSVGERPYLQAVRQDWTRSKSHLWICPVVQWLTWSMREKNARQNQTTWIGEKRRRQTEKRRAEKITGIGMGRDWQDGGRWEGVAALSD